MNTKSGCNAGNPLPDSASSLLSLLQSCQEDNRTIINCVTELLSSKKTEGDISQPKGIQTNGKQPEAVLDSDSQADRPPRKASVGRGMADGTNGHPHFKENGNQTDINNLSDHPIDSWLLKSTQTDEVANSDSDNLEFNDRTHLMIDGMSDIDDDQSSTSMAGNCSTYGESVLTDVSEDIIITDRSDISNTFMGYNSETFLRASHADLDGTPHKEIEDMENTNDWFENRDGDHTRGDVRRARPKGKHLPSADKVLVSDNESECDAVKQGSRTVSLDPFPGGLDGYPRGIEHQSFDSQDAVSLPLYDLHSARISQTPIPGSLNVNTLGHSMSDIRSLPDNEMEITYMSFSTTSQRSLDSNGATVRTKEQCGISDGDDVGIIDQHDTDETASDCSGAAAPDIARSA